MSMSRAEWNRLGYPRTCYLILATIILLAGDLVLLGIVWSIGWRFDPLDRTWILPLLTLPMFAAVLFAMYLGLYRMSRFPRANSEYGNWLLRMPWNAQLRSPFGPWRPIGRDFVVLGTLSLFGLLHALAQSWFFAESVRLPESRVVVGMAIAGPWLGFGLAWLGGGTAIVWGQWKWDWWFTGLAVGLATNCVVHDMPQLLVVLIPVCLIALLITVWRRLERVLRVLPESTVGAGEPITMSQHISKGSYNVQRPYFGMEFDIRRTHIAHCLPANWRLAGAISTLIFVFCMHFVTPSSEPLGLASMAALLVSVLPGLFCALVWRHGTRSHLSLAARWATKRFLVWDYDSAWLIPIAVSPLVSGAVLWIGPSLIWPWLCAPIAIAASSFAVLVVGPDRKRWWLTVPMTYEVEKAERRTVPRSGRGLFTSAS